MYAEKMMTADGPVKSKVDVAFDTTYSHVKTLQDALAELAIRLVPVLSPETQSNPDPNGPRKAPTTVAERLHDVAADVASARDFVASLYSRLEV